EETRVLTRYTSREIADLIDAVGGADKFNTGEVEKSVVNMYGHLQGHIQRGVNELETHTNSILRQKTDTGAFVRGENAYSIVKCAFKDNQTKPKTVTDVKLSVNILDSELISPIFHYQVTVEYLIKDLISKHIIDNIDKIIENLKDDRINQNQEELSDSEIIFAKINNVEGFTDDKGDDPKSKRYSYIAKALMERIADLRAEIDPETFDALNVREHIKKIVDMENIRSRGFNTAINSITAILDTSKMGYQYIENLKNGREVIIREYEDTDLSNLPDERYQIKMRYFDNAQLIEDRKAYDVQLKSFETEIMHLWDILEVIYQDNWKKPFKVNDFEDLAKKNKNKVRKLIKEKSGEPLYEDIAKVWDEISFVKPAETEVEKSNRTYVFEKDRVRTRIIRMRNRLKMMYDFQYPIERRVMEERLTLLEKEYFRFDYMINPYHLQPGLLLDVDITSIKRKKVTLDAMGNVLNEFLSGVSKGFHDASFASFSRRRSTVRDDINRSFGGGEESKPAPAPQTAQTVPEVKTIAAPAQSAAAPKAAAPKKKPGVVDTKAKAKKPAARGGSQLTEI
ncbi:MAG: cytochrome C oxidase subunit II, partial [Treponema sp.]|nr:cytochrome C oxidase subunit II [Treponema sp.]